MTHPATSPDAAPPHRFMRRGMLLLSAVAFLPWLAPGGARVPRHADTGRIVGTVEISTALTTRRPRFRIYADAGPGSIPPATQDPPGGEMRNVVVYVQSADARDGSPAADVSAVPSARLDSLRHGNMAQVNEQFEPHVLTVLQGGRVDFPNHDDVYHNVFSLSSVRTFDLGRYPTGASKSVTFNKAGIVQVFCHIHSDMSAIVFVLPNPYFATPASTGHYEIGDLPPGEYTIVGWHERTKPVARKIRVVAGQTTTVDFNLPLETNPIR
jgi:plastocyanin